MDGMNNDIMKAIMDALGHVNDDAGEKDEKGKPKKMSVTVLEAKPEMGMAHEIPEMGQGESDDDYLGRLKGMHPDEDPMMPEDDWKPEDMSDMPPSMMMQMSALKKKKPEEDDGDHEYR